MLFHAQHLIASLLITSPGEDSSGHAAVRGSLNFAVINLGRCTNIFTVIPYRFKSYNYKNVLSMLKLWYSFLWFKKIIIFY